MWLKSIIPILKSNGMLSQHQICDCFLIPLIRSNTCGSSRSYVPDLLQTVLEGWIKMSQGLPSDGGYKSSSEEFALSLLKIIININIDNVIPCCCIWVFINLHSLKMFKILKGKFCFTQEQSLRGGFGNFKCQSRMPCMRKKIFHHLFCTTNSFGSR